MFKNKVGKKGEYIAAKFLEKKGYKVIAQNFRTKLGEIDIIAEKDDFLVFIEVKTRKSTRYGIPKEYVTKSKIERIFKTASIYLSEKKSWHKKIRFDVIGIILDGGDIKIEHEKDCIQCGDLVFSDNSYWQPW